MSRYSSRYYAVRKHYCTGHSGVARLLAHACECSGSRFADEALGAVILLDWHVA